MCSDSDCVYGRTGLIYTTNFNILFRYIYLYTYVQYIMSKESNTNCFDYVDY